MNFQELFDIFTTRWHRLDDRRHQADINEFEKFIIFKQIGLLRNVSRNQIIKLIDLSNLLNIRSKNKNRNSFNIELAVLNSFTLDFVAFDKILEIFVASPKIRFYSFTWKVKSLELKHE